MPKDCFGLGKLIGFCKLKRLVHAVSVPRFRAILSLAIFLAVCPVVPASAGENVVFDNGLRLPGGVYVNLWHNAPGFAYWGKSLTVNGTYQINNWNGPINVNKSDSLDGNTITVKSGKVTGSVFGAINDRDADVVKYNNVIIYGGQVGDMPGITYVEATSGNVFGGWSNIGQTLGNSVEIYGGTMLGSVYGGSSSTNNAIGNHVFISGGNVKSDINNVLTDLI